VKLLATEIDFKPSIHELLGIPEGINRHKPCHEMQQRLIPTLQPE